MTKLALLNVGILMVLTGCMTTPNPTNYPVGLQHNHTAHGDDHSHHVWDYLSPEKWGDLEVNRLCNAGKAQSPINVAPTISTVKSPLKLVENYGPQDFTVTNNGHTIVFDVKKGQRVSTLAIDGVGYELLQFHYHVPSEHTVMNAHYPLEIHFVHSNANNGLAVVGVLVDTGRYNANLQHIVTNLPSLGQTDKVLKGFDVGTLMPKDTTAYHYEGSLTTPPCNEEVKWFLKANSIQADKAQLAQFAKLYNGNNRPVQPSRGHTLYVVE